MHKKMFFLTTFLFFNHSSFTATLNIQKTEYFKALILSKLLSEAINSEQMKHNAFIPENTTRVTLNNFIEKENIYLSYHHLPQKEHKDFRNFFEKIYRMTLYKFFNQFNLEQFQEQLAKSLQSKHNYQLNHSRDFIKATEIIFDILPQIANTLKQYDVPKEIIKLKEKLKTTPVPKDIAQNKIFHLWINHIKNYLASLKNEKQEQLNKDSAEYHLLKNATVQYFKPLIMQKLKM